VFVQGIGTVDVVTKGIRSRENEIPVRKVHGGSLFSKAEMQSVVVVSRVMCDTRTICCIGAMRQVGMNGFLEAGKRQGNQG
jgi:hypothetical protein